MPRRLRKNCRDFLTFYTLQGSAGGLPPSRLPGRFLIRAPPHCLDTSDCVRKAMVGPDEPTPTNWRDHPEKRLARHAVGALPPVAPTVPLPQSPAPPNEEAARPVPRYQE